jgi:murein L,D-transpeptidase YcbB/YkuD
LREDGIKIEEFTDRKKCIEIKIMKNIHINTFIFNLKLFLLSLMACSDKPDFDISSDAIKNIVEKNADSVDVHRYFPDQDVRNYLHSEFNEFYSTGEYKLAWLTFDEPKEEADELLQAIDAANKEGLSPSHYNVRKIENLLAELYDIASRKERRKEWRKKFKSRKYKEQLKKEDTVLFNKIVRLDFLMTASYLTYASHLLSGKIKPDENAEWYSEPREKNLSSHLHQALDNQRIQASLLELNPPHPQYDKLKEKFARYNEIKRNGGWKDYLITKDLKAGDTGNEVYLLKKRLTIEGFMDGEIKDSVYDPQVKKAVQLYQMLHGIEVTGTVNEKTREELNKPVEAVIQKISFNIERMRWIHGPFGDHYILVNIPDFQMTVIKDHKTQLKMKAIVGEKVNKTPVFNDSLEYIVFSPEWNIPPSIAVEELLPSIKNNPYFFRNSKYELYDGWGKDAKSIPQHSVNWDSVTAENFNYKIVEAPGNANPLGKVKFIFPNSQSIYLHDTPANHLFSQNERDFSHGCIRLEKPEKFAQYLLADRGWDVNDVKEYMNKKEPATVLLGEKIPVYIVYWTAWVDENNNYLNLRNDVYQYDQYQMKEIEKKDKVFNKVAG